MDNIHDLIKLQINLRTIKEVTENCSDFPYVKNISDATDVALLAVDAKIDLYFSSVTK
jgi:hypothetical protein